MSYNERWSYKVEDKDLEKGLDNQEESKNTKEETQAQDETTADAVQENNESVVDQENEKEQSNEETASKTGKSFFKRDKKDKKDSKDVKIDELNDRLIRTMAEFDNFRKRTEKEKTQMFEIGAKSIIEKILPVIDNFERGLGTVSEEEKNNGFVQGMEKIYKQLLTSMEDTGLKAIEAVGKEFDPNYHNAVMHGDDPEQGDNLVVEEFQKGYMYKDSVVRHSMVKVVN